MLILCKLANNHKEEYYERRKEACTRDKKRRCTALYIEYLPVVQRYCEIIE